MAEQKDDAAERSHEPTQRKLEEAFKRGDVARSIEVNTWFVLAGLTLAVLIGPGLIGPGLTSWLVPFIAKAHQLPADGGGLMRVGREALLVGLMLIALPFAFAFVAAIAGGLVQHRPLWTTTPLTPQLSRISPLAGFKRLFGREAFVQFTKGLIKLSLIGALVGYLVWVERDRFEMLAQLDASALIPAVKVLVMKMLATVLAVFGVVAGIDFLYQRFTWMERNRMTKQELKEEFKETEGNPEIKAKLRQMRLQRARSRMMQQVPTATVIITNPTHYAVALRYEKGMPAPICVAKGVDSLALRIRTLAGEHEIPIVENPPLARALHATVDIDGEIPVEHYKAVAEVVGYVMRLRSRRN
jgi:flagellar biosynthetic protein FlhB